LGQAHTKYGLAELLRGAARPVRSWYADQVESFASILRESSPVTFPLSLVQ
jgi:hypothetical protein